METSAAARAELFDLAPCGLLLLGPDFGIRHANSYFAELIGLGAAERPSLKLRDLLTPAGRVFLQAHLQQQLALAGRVDELVLDIVHRDGRRVPVMLNATQDSDPEGRPGDIRMAVWRAAAKRAYEAEVPKAREEAALATRVKADFLANISHEIRTPLNGVVGVASVLEGSSLTEPQKEMVATIQSSAASLERLVSDMLDVAKVQSGQLSLELQTFSLREQISGVLEKARLEALAKGLDFEAALDLPDDSRLGDPVRLKQAVGILLSNAVKFTSNGEVSVLASLDASERLVIEVRDTGVGFESDAAETLFLPFQQSDSSSTRQFGGAGIGLSICKGIVDLMGGQIQASSRPALGSTFVLSVPLPRALQTAPDVEDAAPLDTGSLQVLLVEDNPTNQKVVQLIMSGFGIEVAVAANGLEGLEAWKQGSFDLVLMDMQMPVMDGLTAIREIRKAEASGRQSRTPIAVLSANAMEHHRREALAAGADLHIAKPVTVANLIGGVQQVLHSAAPPGPLDAPQPAG